MRRQRDEGGSPAVGNDSSQKARAGVMPTRRSVLKAAGATPLVPLLARLAAGQQAPKGYTVAMAGAVIAAMRQLTAEGFAPFKNPPFWKAQDLSDDEAAAAAEWSQFVINSMRLQVQESGAGTLPDSDIAKLIVLRIDTEKMIEDIQAKPEEGLRPLLKSLPDLLQVEFDLWASRTQKPRDFVIASDLRRAIEALPSSASDMGSSLAAVLQALRPSEFKGFKDQTAFQAIQRVRTAAMQAGFLINVTVQGYERYPGAYGVHFDAYEVRRDIPFETEELDGLRVPVVQFTPLGHAAPLNGVIVAVPGLRPFIAIMLDSLREEEAQYMVDIRDGRKTQTLFDLPEGWTEPTYRRFLNFIFRDRSVVQIAKSLTKGILAHEIFHLWFAAKRHRLRDADQRYGLLPAEWEAFRKTWSLDSQQNPRRILDELAANLGNLAVSDEPLNTLRGYTEFTAGKRLKVQAIVMDYIVRAVAGKLSASLESEAGRLSKTLSSQTAPVTTETALSWIQAIPDATVDLPRLNQLIQEAARGVYSDTFVTETGETARLPEKLKTLALLRRDTLTFLADNRSAAPQMPRSAFLLPFLRAIRHGQTDRDAPTPGGQMETTHERSSVPLSRMRPLIRISGRAVLSGLAATVIAFGLWAEQVWAQSHAPVTPEAPAAVSDVWKKARIPSLAPQDIPGLLRIPLARSPALQKDLPKRDPKYQRALRSRDFARFYRLVIRSYALDFAKDLEKILELYLDPPLRQSMESKARIKAFQLIRQEFPDVHFEVDSLTYVADLFPELSERGWGTPLTIIDRFMGQPGGELRFRKILARTRLEFEGLSFLYGAQVTTGKDLGDFLQLPREHRDRLLNVGSRGAATKRTFDYLKRTYSKDLKIETLSVSALCALYQGQIAPFVQNDFDPQILDGFLNVLGTNLMKVTIHDLLGDMRRMGLGTPAMKSFLNQPPTQFEAFLQRQKGINPKVAKFLERLKGGAADKETIGISHVIAAFATPDAQDRLAKVLLSFGFQSPAIWDPSNIDLQIRVLEKLKAACPRLQLGRQEEKESPFAPKLFGPLLRDPQGNGQKLLALERALEGGRAQELEHRLRDSWGLKTIELGSFLEALSGEPGITGFLMDPASPARWQALQDKYGLLALDSVHDDESVKTATLETLVAHGRTLVETEQQNLLAETINFMKECDPFWIRIYNGLLPADRAADYARTKYVHDPLFPAYYRRLKDFGMSGDSIHYLFMSLEIAGGDLSTTWPGVHDLAGPERYKRLEQFYAAHIKNRSFSKGDRVFLQAITMTGPVDQDFQILESLAAMGVDFDDGWNFEHIQRQLLGQPAVRRALLDPQFPPFVRALQSALWPGKLDVKAIQELAKLFNDFTARPEDLKFLRTRRFRQVVSVVQSELKLSELHPATIKPLLQLARASSAGRLKSFLRNRGQGATSNDVVLISQVLSEATLEARLQDRPGLLAAMARVYERPPVLRGRRDLEESLKTNIATSRENGLDASEAEAMVDQARQRYTERPDLSKASSLQLLRLVLIDEGLRQPGVLSSLVPIIEADLKDKTTELGGIVHRVGRALVFEAQNAAHIGDDDAYSPPSFNQLIEGIANFHLHALKEEAAFYAAPSGSVLYIGGDIGSAMSNRLAGVVITPLARQGKGFRINIDAYFVEEGQAYIVDFGEFDAQPETPSATPESNHPLPHLQQAPKDFLEAQGPDTNQKPRPPVSGSPASILFLKALVDGKSLGEATSAGKKGLAWEMAASTALGVLSILGAVGILPGVLVLPALVLLGALGFIGYHWNLLKQIKPESGLSPPGRAQRLEQALVLLLYALPGLVLAITKLLHGNIPIESLVPASVALLIAPRAHYLFDRRFFDRLEARTRSVAHRSDIQVIQRTDQKPGVTTEMTVAYKGEVAGPKRLMDKEPNIDVQGMSTEDALHILYGVVKKQYKVHLDIDRHLFSRRPDDFSRNLNLGRYGSFDSMGGSGIAYDMIYSVQDALRRLAREGKFSGSVRGGPTGQWHLVAVRVRNRDGQDIVLSLEEYSERAGGVAKQKAVALRIRPWKASKGLAESPVFEGKLPDKFFIRSGPGESRASNWINIDGSKILDSVALGISAGLSYEDAVAQAFKISKHLLKDLASRPPLPRRVIEKIARDNQDLLLRQFIGIPESEEAGTLPQFSGYRTLGLIRKGGFGAVYKAVSENDSSHFVAIKVPREEIFWPNVMGEATILESLNSVESRYFLKFYGLHRHPDGYPYIVMEFSELDSLAGYLATKGSRSEAQNLGLFLEVANALMAAHQSGVIHVDFHPGNVLAGYGNNQPQAKLVDFGVSTLSSDAGQPRDTLMPGVPGFRPPEGSAAGEMPGPAYDIYGLGVMLYMLMSQQKPDVIYEGIQRQGDLEIMINADKTVPGYLKPIILKATSFNPEERYQSVQDLKVAISAPLSGPKLLPAGSNANQIAARPPESGTPASILFLKALVDGKGMGEALDAGNRGLTREMAGGTALGALSIVSAAVLSVTGVLPGALILPALVFLGALGFAGYHWQLLKQIKPQSGLSPPSRGQKLEQAIVLLLYALPGLALAITRFLHGNLPVESLVLGSAALLIVPVTQYLYDRRFFKSLAAKADSLLETIPSLSLLGHRQVNLNRENGAVCTAA